MNDADGDLAQRMFGEAVNLVAACRVNGGEAQIMGGIAVALHSPAGGRVEAHRSFPDIDLFVMQRHARVLKAVLKDAGYEPHVSFNTLNSRERMIYFGADWKIDVFVNRFSMCHTIDLASRVGVDSPTISVGDLLLTKLQVVELNEKDIVDVDRLFDTHDLADADGDVINTAYLGQALSRDWGLWRTVTANLEQVASERPKQREKIASLLAKIETAPKSLGFRSRALIGEKKRWYSLPEESIR